MASMTVWGSLSQMPSSRDNAIWTARKSFGVRHRHDADMDDVATLVSEP